jgi:hypothetical protein
LSPSRLALDKLRRGEISALAYVATKPSRLFQDIRPDENLHFLPITGNLPPIYASIAITSNDYPDLVSNDAPVKTVEVGTVLLAYDWPPNSERYQRVNHFVQTFFAHIKDIQASRAKWHPFDITSSVSGWTRFSPDGPRRAASFFIDGKCRYCHGGCAIGPVRTGLSAGGRWIRTFSTGTPTVCDRVRTGRGKSNRKNI